MYNHVRNQIFFLTNGPDSKGNLAQIRRGVGKRLDESYETWQFILSEIPEQLLSKTPDCTPTPAENAIFTAITLFAVHQQSQTNSVNKSGSSFGEAVGKMARNSVNDSIKKRFDAVITSNDLEELTNHARGLINLMRFSDIGIGFDYALFAKDLYYFQFPDSRRSVVFRWGQDYYRNDLKKDE